MKLTINNQKLEFSFGLGFLGEVLDVYDLSIDQLLGKVEKNPYKWFPILVYESAKWVCNDNNEEVTFTLKDIQEKIDKDGAFTTKNKFITWFSETFIKSILKDVPVEETKEKEGAKKK